MVKRGGVALSTGMMFFDGITYFNGVNPIKLWEDSHGRSETAPLFLSEVNFSTSHR